MSDREPRLAIELSDEDVDRIYQEYCAKRLLEEMAKTARKELENERRDCCR